MATFIESPKRADEFYRRASSFARTLAVANVQALEERNPEWHNAIGGKDADKARDVLSAIGFPPLPMGSVTLAKAIGMSEEEIDAMAKSDALINNFYATYSMAIIELVHVSRGEPCHPLPLNENGIECHCAYCRQRVDKEVCHCVGCELTRSFGDFPFRGALEARVIDNVVCMSEERAEALRKESLVAPAKGTPRQVAEAFVKFSIECRGEVLPE